MRTMLSYDDQQGPRKVIVQTPPEQVAALTEQEQSWTAMTTLGQVTIESAKVITYAPYV
jgi:hypothetical protein